MKFVLSFFLSCFLLPSFGQEEKSSEVSEPWTFRGAEKIIKVSPLDLVSFVSTVGADLEVQLKDRMSVQVGAAVVPAFMQVMSLEEFNDYERMGGYRLRAEGRMYMPVFRKFYFAYGLSFRHLIIRDVVAVGMEGVESENLPGEPNFAYFKNIPMVFNRFNTNMDMKWGVQLKTDMNFAFDFYCGLSVRNVLVRTNSEMPEVGQVPAQRGVWTLEHKHKITYPIPIVGVKIGLVR